MVFLNNKQLIKINNVIDNLNMQFDLNFPETSIIELARLLGISIKIGRFKDEEIAGLLDYGSDEEDPVIFISEKDNEKKRNFTIAHEIGHLLLHEANGGRFKIDKYDFHNSRNEATQETEANYFAAELLVPQYKLKEIIFKANMPEWDLINFCSEYFNVSKSVIVNRLKWIKF